MRNNVEKHRICDHPGCENKGEFRAPRDRSLENYYWFCLAHVREYNKNWNYYEGYDADAMERAIRADVIWQRPTRPFGSLGQEKNSFHLPQNIVRALELFGLAFPYTLKELRDKYKTLAKKYHPDTNHGDRFLEEKFKNLTQNYKILLEFIY